jgi:hypothetical protein
MRKAAWLGICALALGLGASVASADVITIAVTGHVSTVFDSSSGVGVGQAVTATYAYDTTTPASGPPPVGTGATYTLTAPPANINVTVVGGPTYQAQNSWTQQIYIMSAGGNQFIYHAQEPASSGSTAIDLAYSDGTGWLNPPALPTTAPPAISNQFNGSIYIYPSGGSPGFSVQIDTAAPAPAITVSPANSSFIAQQNFDAVLLLSAQLSVTSMQASVNGTSIGLSYPGTCQTAAANGALRTALICPNASTVLAGLGGGPVTINWLITLADGSTLQQSVIWNLIL